MKNNLKSSFKNSKYNLLKHNCSIMDKRSYLTKLIEPNEQFYMLLIDVMMYCKYRILNDESAANDSSIVDLLKKSKSSLIKLLH